jgi:hypothetical protein
MNMMNLDELAKKNYLDKGSPSHNYAEKYDQILSHLRKKITNVMEIGVFRGASLKVWEEYFPNAIINGVDIDPECKISESGRIKISIADQGNETQLKELEKLGPFDLIIDDGSHIWKHQILTFKTLFPFIKRGGIYIVEDTCSSYLPDQYGPPPTCIDYFRGLIDEVNYYGKITTKRTYHDGGWFTEDIIYGRREDWQETKTDIRSIQFMNGLIIVYKKPEGYV